jgi:hypothetical protein
MEIIQFIVGLVVIYSIVGLNMPKWARLPSRKHAAGIFIVTISSP